MRRILLAAIIIVSIFIYFPVFCFVEEIIIEGNNLVPSEEIIKTSEINGKILAFYNKNETINKIMGIKLIKDIRIEQVSYNKIKLLLKEKDIIMSTNISGTLGHIDENSKFIKNISEYLIKNYPILTIESESQIKKGVLLLKLLNKEKVFISDDISEILIDKIMGATIFTNDGIEIYLGKEEFKKKIKNLAIILKNGKDKNMKESFIDVSNINKGVVNYNL